MPNFTLADDVFLRAAAQYPTPFYLYDAAGMQRTAKALQQAFSWNPRFKEYFAVKALPNPHISRLLVEAGCGLDCSSHCELMIAEQLGVRGDSLMFSANAMPPEEFAFARRLQGIINLDDITDIDTLQQNGGIPETICLRFNPGGDFGDGNAIMGSPKDSKFGMTRPQLGESLHRLKALGTRKFGLHAFLASNMLGEVYYPLLARLLFETGQQLQAETGLQLDFVNLSGGIGIPYRPTDTAPGIGLIGRKVEEVYRAAFGSDNSVAIKTELGRHLTGPHGWLVAKARHEKRTHKHYIGLDACASNLLRPAMYGAYHHISVVGKRNADPTETYDITGALCENNDKFAIDRALPPIEMGDLVILHDAGAHAHTMGYQYNGRLRSAEVLYKPDGSFQLIRRAETPEDYFATLHGEGLPAL